MRIGVTTISDVLLSLDDEVIAGHRRRD